MQLTIVIAVIMIFIAYVIYEVFVSRAMNIEIRNNSKITHTRESIDELNRNWKKSFNVNKGPFFVKMKYSDFKVLSDLLTKKLENRKK